MNIQVLDAGCDASGGYGVDVTRGKRVGRVSSEWFSRPADERYLLRVPADRDHGFQTIVITHSRAS